MKPAPTDQIRAQEETRIPLVAAGRTPPEDFPCDCCIDLTKET